MPESFAPQPEGLRSFSKENYQIERDECARQVREARQKYFSKKKNLLTLIEHSQEHAEYNSGLLAEYEETINDLRSQLQIIKSNHVLGIMLGWLAARKQAQIDKTLARAQYAQESIEKSRKSVVEFQEELKQETEVKKYKQIYGNFIEDQQRKFTEHNEKISHQQQVEQSQKSLEHMAEEEQARDLRFVCNKYNTLIVHVTAGPGLVSPATTKVKPDISELMKMKIVCAVQPCISTSSLQEGEGADWTADNGSPGLIISDGNITMASHVDAFSVPDDRVGRRAQYAMMTEMMSPDELASLNDISLERIKKVFRAKQGNASSTYNELAVAEGKP